MFQLMLISIFVLLIEQSAASKADSRTIPAFPPNISIPRRTPLASLFWQQIGAEVLSVLLRNADIFREIAVDNELEQQREEEDQASPARRPRPSTEMPFRDVGDRGCAAAEKSAKTDATAIPTPRSGATVLDGGNFGGGAGKTFGRGGGGRKAEEQRE